ncbi:YdiU family protein [Savagea sp. SN6]|uniref:Protein nucleotidyltransferase YdiU n=1 Tax=Savagea serpentis TaxID=2785297 RepID=A0A8J7KFC3_9BACL|nr:YdiU family protein [Savagea serpentis]MBF4502106.1 YdiU family protein [Savagea serpentis]
MKWTSSYRMLPRMFYQDVLPSVAKDPSFVLWNESLAEQLQLTDWHDETGLLKLSGAQLDDCWEPLAQAYMGHQFGHLTMLGDGRAILLGELETERGVVDLQLKGSGQTPFSRRGDGRAGLGPMLREYVMSEALFYLNISTTRSLAVIETGETVWRERPHRGALVVRVASSHLRVGTFQYAYHYGTSEDVKALADYAIQKHYPHVDNAENRYISLFREVMKRQAALIAKWQAVGFIHGVMNTDNMTISGETIDYGPCAFMNQYDLDTVFSSIDVQGRYAYGRQPQIGGWNLARFVETLLPLFGEGEEGLEIAQRELNAYGSLFEHYWLEEMRKKLALHEGEEALLDELFVCMRREQRDWTETFRDLTVENEECLQLECSKEMKDWYVKWKQTTEGREQELQKMQEVNPAFIPRNHLVDQAIERMELTNDRTLLERLLRFSREPFAYTEEQLAYRLPEEEKTRMHQTFCGT